MPQDDPVQFAVVREDPEIELDLLRNLPPSRGEPLEALLVASGGCTALTLAALRPDVRLTLLDANAARARRAVADLLPPAIARRRKKPFTTPISPWFFSPRAPALFRDALSSEEIRRVGLFCPDTVAGWLAALPSEPTGHVRRFRQELALLPVLSSQLLHRLFVQGRDRPAVRFPLRERSPDRS